MFAQDGSISLCAQAGGGERGGEGGLLEAGEEVELLAAEEAELHPAEDVIHDGLGVAELFAAGPAGGLEAGVGELLDEDLERDAVLERHGDRSRERIHQAGYR